MTKLIVHSDAVAIGVVHPVACLIHDVSVQRAAPALEEPADLAMRRLDQDAERLLGRPTVAGFRELFARLGYPEQVPAGERVVRAFQRYGTFKRINNLVDASNLATLSFGGGLGLHDANGILGSTEDIHVHRARGGEAIVPLFKHAATAVDAGDLVYGLGAPPTRPLAWLGRQDVDSDDSRIADRTRSVLLVALGNASTTEEHNLQVCLTVFELVERTCPDSRLERLTTVSLDGAGED
jgi:DNA/RNA-binding domain of Phe-tRNA-synthetase-like protein